MPKRHVVLGCLVLALCVCFAFGPVGVSIAEALHEDHHCVFDERCTVCVHIRDAKQLLKRLFLVLMCCALLLDCVLRLAGGQGSIALEIIAVTPVAFKVRMNN